MKFSIGIITAEQSLGMIRRIHAAMSEACDIEYLPYSTLQQLADVYRESAHCFDGLLFSGIFPYEYVINYVGNVIKPYEYFELADRDYYRIFAKIFFQRPALDLSRILMDRPTAEMDFSEIFAEKRPRFFNNVVGNTPVLGAAYETTMEEALALWREKKIDLVISRFTNLIEPLKASGIECEALFPSVASMTETFDSLYFRLQALELNNSLTASAIVACDVGSKIIKTGELEQRLAKFNEEHGMSLVVRPNGIFYEITTSNEVLKDISRQYSHCLLSEYLQVKFGKNVFLGWGLGRDIVRAQRNAQLALQEARRNGPHHAYLIDEQGRLIGPLTSGYSIALKLAPSAEIEELSRQLGISPANLQKLIGLQEKQSARRFSSADLAFYLNITVRSANRILAKLAAHNLAKVVETGQFTAKGRPFKIYEVDFHVLSRPKSE